MKKFLYFTFLFIFMSTAFLYQLKANSISSVTIVDGASIRNTGETQGIKFKASCSNLDESIEHGFYIALGEHSKEEFKLAIESDSLTIGANKLKKVSANGNSLDFAVTIYDIPSSAYLQDISAVAYVKYDSFYELSSISVTRNISEVSMILKSNGDNSEIVNDVVSYTNSNYKKFGLDGLGNYVVTDFQERNPKVLFSLFLNDWNHKFDLNLTTSLEARSFLASTISDSATVGTSNNANKNISDSNLYRFFNDDLYQTKWSWLLNFLKTFDNVHTNRQITAIENDGTNNDYTLYGGEHLSASLYNFFTAQSKAVYYYGIDFSNFSNYNNLKNFCTIYNDKNYDIVRIGDNINLPLLNKTGYTHTGFTSLNSNYLPNANYDITSNNDKFIATYTPIEYSVSFYEIDTELEELGFSYTIEDSNTLPSYSKPGYTFNGWYDNSDFAGIAYTTIPRGSYGNKTFYAKFIRNLYSYVNKDYSIYNNGDKVIIDEVEHEFGNDVFSNIADALNAASDATTIYVASGTYSENLTINNNGISIIGPNATIDPNTGVRNEEAVITGNITLARKINNTTIKGLKFSGFNVISSTPEGNKESTSYNNVGFNFLYNYVDTNLESGNGFINFTESDRSYSKDLLISHCYFNENSSYAAIDLISLTNNVNININNSKFTNIKSNVLATYDTTNTRGGAGNIFIEDNTFINITKSILWGDFVSGITYGDYGFKFNRNYVENCDGGACVDIEGSNSAATYTTFEVIGNTFKNVWKVLWLNTGATTCQFKLNKIYEYSGAKGTQIAYISKSGGQAINASNNLYYNKSLEIVTPNTTLKNGYVSGWTFYNSLLDYENALDAYLNN